MLAWIFFISLLFRVFFIPSIQKSSSVLPTYKMGKPLDFPLLFRPTSVAYCVSNMFERILSRLLFFLECNSIFSFRQVGFRPSRSTFNQIVYLSQSISDGFNKPKPGSWIILIAETSPKLSTLSGILLFPRVYFCWPPFLLCSMHSIFSI